MELKVVASLGRAELVRRLRHDGLYLQTGCFIMCVKSPIGHIVDAISVLYADYPVVGDAGFADFYITMARPGGLRRFVRQQVAFDHDGSRPFKPLPIDQAFPMFEWVMNWCVSSRANRYLIIHAAVVEKHGRAFILPAPPGSGKSTLCAGLVSRGWRLLSDELAMLQLDNGQVQPLPRPVSLKNASIEVMRQFAPGAVFGRAVQDTSKGTIAHMKAPTDSVRRAAETAAPAAIVFPRYVANAPAVLESIPKARSFMRVAQNAFNYSVLADEGFDALARLVGVCDSHDFSYGSLDDAIAVFDTLAGAAP